jgi:hypothetical protein
MPRARFTGHSALRSSRSTSFRRIFPKRLSDVLDDDSRRPIRQREQRAPDLVTLRLNAVFPSAAWASPAPRGLFPCPVAQSAIVQRGGSRVAETKAGGLPVSR